MYVDTTLTELVNLLDQDDAPPPTLTAEDQMRTHLPYEDVACDIENYMTREEYDSRIRDVTGIHFGSARRAKARAAQDNKGRASRQPCWLASELGSSRD